MLATGWLLLGGGCLLLAVSCLLLTGDGLLVVSRYRADIGVVAFYYKSRLKGPCAMSLARLLVLRVDGVIQNIEHRCTGF